MRQSLQYGKIGYQGASVGDVVRFVNGPSVGVTGAVLQPRNANERNAVLRSVTGDLGLVEILSSTPTQAEVGSASGVHISLPITARSRVKIGT